MTGKVNAENNALKGYILALAKKYSIPALEYENILCKFWCGYFKNKKH